MFAQQAVIAQSSGVAIGTMIYQSRDAVAHAVRLEPRPVRVVGRDDLIGDLRARLTGTATPATVALCGLGGVGKTTVALEYAHRFKDQYQLVWLFHAEDATSLLSQFHDLTQVLDPADLLERSDPVARVHAALAAHPGPWLLVLDNIRDHAAARRWLPPKGRGHVLVTTQDGHWPPGQAVEVGTLTLAAATGFLLDRAGDFDTASAQAIAHELGLLPLALAQAAAYVETTGRSLAQYLDLLRTDRARVLQRGAPTGHSTPVVATWSLALDDLATTSPGSITLLRLLACLAPEAIPFRLLLDNHTPLPATIDPVVAGQIDTLRGDAFTIDDAVARLRRHSLIGPPTDLVTVHRLVQAVTLDQIDPTQRTAWQAAAAALVEAVIPADVEQRAAWATCARLLPHAQAVLDPLSTSMRRLAWSFGAAGDYLTALAVWGQLADAHTTGLGPEHPDTLNARANLARFTGQAGDAAAARDLYAALLPVRQRVSGAEHPDTLSARANLAHFTGQAGDAVGARDLYAALLPVRERVLGAEHPDTLTARANLAYWTGQAGNAVAARDLYAALLPVQERVSGAEHPNTLSARANLARFTGQAGDAVAARDLYAALLPVQERISGPEHPDTLTARDNLAHWTGDAGDAAAARDLYAALLPVQERISGAEHPDTLNARDNLAHWTRKAQNA